MATIKTTNKDFYNAVIALATTGECAISANSLVEWAEKKIAQLENKAGKSSSKPTAKQTENETLKAEILRVLRENGGYMTIKDIVANSEMLTELDIVNQRMSALLRQLGQNEIGSGEVEKKTEKRVTYFKAVEVDETAEGEEITE